MTASLAIRATIAIRWSMIHRDPSCSRRTSSTRLRPARRRPASRRDGRRSSSTISASSAPQDGGRIGRASMPSPPRRRMGATSRSRRAASPPSIASAGRTPAISAGRPHGHAPMMARSGWIPGSPMPAMPRTGADRRRSTRCASITPCRSRRATTAPRSGRASKDRGRSRTAGPSPTLSRRPGSRTMLITWPPASPAMSLGTARRSSEWAGRA